MADAVPNYKSLASQYAKAKRLKQKEKERELQEANGRPKPLTPQLLRLQQQFKGSHTRLVLLLAWFLLIHGLGIYFFTKGFLLTRLVLDHQSSCAESPLDSADAGTDRPSRHEDGCWHPKTFDKAIIIIVDALRYDFTVPFRASTEATGPHHFHDAIPFFYETAVDEPDRAFLLPFIADPPTTTLQRLKGLTTGTLPTFIDAGSNFAGTAIEEDNLIGQLRIAGKNVVHLGDDTWHSLFPGYFDPDLTRKYDSFNVWDLHTVDNGVNEHLFPLLQAGNTSKWDVLIGHYLGVDHAGHRYGPDHPAMTAKLRQMDATFREVTAQMDESTLLVVMGDHGMDVKGDHGGESFDEVQAALWMYSKRGVFGRTSSEALLPPSDARERPVGQIDLVPTLSLLLGLPIPFNNLGTPIAEAFIGRKGGDWKNLARASHLTAAQIKKYQSEYAKARGLEAKSTSGPLARWEAAEKMLNTTVSHSAKAQSTEWKGVYEAFLEYQKETLSICRGLWARFDVPSMVEGISILAVALLLLLCYGLGLAGDLDSISRTVLIRLSVGTAVGVLSGVLTPSLVSELDLMDTTLLGAVAGGCLGFATVIMQHIGLLSLLPSSLWSGLALVFTVSQSVGFASNSYTIWEDEILLYFLTTFGVLAFVSSLRRQDLVERALGGYQSLLFIFLGRMASLSRLCREEQMPFCRSTYYASANSSTSAVWQIIIPYVVALILPDIVKSYYRGTRSYEGSAVFWIGVAFRIGLLLTAIFWTLDAADDGEWFDVGEGLLKTIRMSIAQTVLAVALAAGSTYFAWAKPCVKIDVKTSLKTAAGVSTASTPPGSTVTVLGWANTHGSRYLLLVSNICLAVLLVQKPMGHLSIGTMLFQILCLVEILDANGLSEGVIGPVMLCILGNFHFFKTGHQATLSSIQWEAAFIPFRTIQYPWSPILVFGNTYGAQILATASIPLLVLWKQPPKQPRLVHRLARALAASLAFHATVNLAASLWAAHLRRHLMLYRIFSPRWMTSAAVLLVVDAVVLVVVGSAVRVNTLSVADIFGW